ncbi:MAG: hypothetical protein HBSAPP02_05880 [Phycisphaerae bacterium]|nr:MAG: thioredoxin family protein [Planctomycetia bacterium]RIK68642.1 MAG: hypothetical protein DCC66_09835 [Planctomycetota bacterium]GJQ25556.1 MAG: hypothetical protein HBSAPP02_05880 [Phycisphaerae bacterium]
MPASRHAPNSKYPVNIRPGRTARLRTVLILAMSMVSLPAASTAHGEPASKPVTASHVTLQAFADRAAIVPGEPVNLAVTLQPEEGWHTYWINPGPNGGLPTVVKWTGPAGWQVGRARYPVPTVKYDPTLEGDSYYLPSNAVILTPLRGPNDAASGTNVELIAEVSFLACKKECIPGKAKLTLTLPVAAKGAKPSPANEALFKRAHRALPEPLDQAEHVKISVASDAPIAAPGKSFNVIVSADLERGAHMQSHKPLDADYIAAYVFVEPTDGLEIGDVDYPPGVERTDKVLGKLSEYSGKVAFKVPVTVSEDAGTAPRHVRGILQYQICNDSGTCYPPQRIEWSLPIRMEGGPAPATGDDEFAATATPENAIGATPTGSEGAERAGDRTVAESSGATHSGANAPSASGSSNLATWLSSAEAFFNRYGFTGVLAMAFIGGLVLNLMPCVLPVISLKVLSFVRQAGEDRGRILALGLTYCAGILVFFGFLAVLFATTGTGWGQLFQKPRVVIGLAAVVTAFALSLFGVFAVFTPKVIDHLGQKAAEREGLPSAFATGLLATFLGTACTAPFLSAAVGAATRYPPAQGAMIFMAVGMGMAFPFVLLSAQPAWLKFVPRPGPWMHTFEVLMGFLLLGTAVWLLNPLRDQIGDWGLLLTIIFLLFVSLAVWVKGRIQFGDPPSRKLAMNGLALAIVAVGWLLPFRAMGTIDDLRLDASHRRKLINDGKLFAQLDPEKRGEVAWKPDWSRGIPWLEYDEEHVRRYVEAGYTVFVDFTASWCASCKTNLKTSIDVEATRALMRELNVVPIEADYSSEDPMIKSVLARFKRAGVPLYLVYSPGRPDDPQILPELLTPQIVTDALRKAGPSKPERLAAGS